MFATVVVLASCSSGEMQTSPPPGNGGDITTSAHVATCVPTCSVAADCGMPGDPLYDPSHFSCTGGTCVWNGCTSAAACNQAAPQGGNYVCKAENGGPPACLAACQKPADCVAANNQNPLETASHFACNAGVCTWLGCMSTAECASALGTNNVACEQPPGAPGKTCVGTCSTPSDCASQQPLNDASHFACTAGRCQWLGCKSNAECSAALQSSRVACR
jgi:hypothetical protein